MWCPEKEETMKLKKSVVQETFREAKKKSDNHLDKSEEFVLTSELHFM